MKCGECPIASPYLAYEAVDMVLCPVTAVAYLITNDCAPAAMADPKRQKLLHAKAWETERLNHG
jgi:hypothetical protein